MTLAKRMFHAMPSPLDAKSVQYLGCPIISLHAYKEGFITEVPGGQCCMTYNGFTAFHFESAL